MGIVLSFSASGMITGPTISGILLKFMGYWLTWIVPVVVLLVDVFARVLMIEPYADMDAAAHIDPNSVQETLNEDEEVTSLLESRATSYQTIMPQVTPESNSEKQNSNFYRTMLVDGGVLTGLASCVLYSTILTSFENTLPLHTQRAFGWDSFPTSIMFFCLQIPSILLGPLCGWVRDRFGIRHPSVAGWAAMIPFLCLLGTPGNDWFPWAKASGPAITIMSMVTIGTLNNLVQGSGPMELSGTSSISPLSIRTKLLTHGDISRCKSIRIQQPSSLRQQRGWLKSFCVGRNCIYIRHDAGPSHIRISGSNGRLLLHERCSRYEQSQSHHNFSGCSNTWRKGSYAAHCQLLLSSSSEDVMRQKTKADSPHS